MITWCSESCRSWSNDERAVARPPAGKRAANGIIARKELVGEGIVADHEIEDLSLRFVGSKNRLRRIDGVLVARSSAVGALNIEGKSLTCIDAGWG